MMHPRLFFILVMIMIGGSNNSVNAHCNGTCDRLTLPYPFGFSDDCQIQFNCSKSGLATIGDFSVQNVTVDSIFVAVQHDCSRTIEDMKPLFSEIYAPLSDNIFLLKDCIRLTNECSIKLNFLESQLKMERCKAKGNVNCLSLDMNTTKFLSMDHLSQSSCRLLLSSISFESIGANAEVELNLEQARLGGWLKGDCTNVTCSENAVCTQVNTPGGNSGHRCSCPEGYHGDGFIHPCRKGNPLMCGLPTNRSCSDVEEEDNVFDMVGFYWSLIMSYVIVFTGFIVFLSFESSPRQAWFSLVDNFILSARKTLRVVIKD